MSKKPVSEKQIVVYAYNGIILGNNKGRTTKNMNESLKNIMLSDRSLKPKCAQCRILCLRHLSTDNVEYTTGDKPAADQARAGQNQRLSTGKGLGAWDSEFNVGV